MGRRSGENDSAVAELGLRFHVQSRLTSGGPPPGGAQAGEDVWLSGEPYLLPSRPHQRPALISPDFMGPEIKRWRVKEVKTAFCGPGALSWVNHLRRTVFSPQRQAGLCISRGGCRRCCSFWGSNWGDLIQSGGRLVLLESRAHVESGEEDLRC